MIVVSNTTPLSELAKIGRLNLLPDLFGKIIIPQEVYDELTTGTHPAATQVPLVDWIEVRSVRDSHKISALQASTGIDLGEAAAIILAEELDVTWVLIDDLDGRRVAQSRDIPVTGTIGTLLFAKDRGLILNVKELLDALIAGGKRISPKLYREVLATAGE
ncbi:DUF3368 domain-containing protein [Oscillatoria sp. HE19RPO]|jgi:predicted nucleic acid-binding protein|uniref:DUF3368 domain-containing protein n=1 Tax=Oscillatoria sp. HE19RPO TaxID=2954806 RepID=UPI0020C405C5|nr:DUF3368 domain-containing protein [Oscillatoria sp. HE19RPO]